MAAAPLRLCGAENTREKELSGGHPGNSLPEGEIDAIAIVIERDIISIIIIIIISTIYTAITTAAPRHRCNNSVNPSSKLLPTPSAPRWDRHSYLSKILRYTPYTCGSSRAKKDATIARLRAKIVSLEATIQAQEEQMREMEDEGEDIQGGEGFLSDDDDFEENQYPEMNHYVAYLDFMLYKTRKELDNARACR
ncbi:hypothetical protein QYE76_040949 [Lolium multiflorum]|uniref:Uncharacterized protein n=1 Tax=Lolium multiflorum TaxID=4521 RepID=A0AAD8WVH1_LOLMU|nr:hypothetical protein QYE76_040949 [Lolium multiflorum]